MVWSYVFSTNHTIIISLKNDLTRTRIGKAYKSTDLWAMELFTMNDFHAQYSIHYHYHLSIYLASTTHVLTYLQLLLATCIIRHYQVCHPSSVFCFWFSMLLRLFFCPPNSQCQHLFGKNCSSARAWAMVRLSLSEKNITWTDEFEMLIVHLTMTLYMEYVTMTIDYCSQ